MRAIVLAALACATLAAGCSNPCQELGDRLCNCRDPGTTKASCSQSVQSEIDRLHPGSNTKAACSKALDDCHEPEGVSLCDWIEGQCGKAACGLSEEDIDTLRTKPVDDKDPACQADPTVAACPKVCQ